MGTTNNIVVGMNSQSMLKVGDYGAEETSAADVGFIKGGISIQHSEEHYDIKVDQALAAIGKVKTDESMKIKLSLAEATLANLALAFGYPTDSVAGSAFNFGDSEGVYKTLYITVAGTAENSRKYSFWKVKPTGATMQEYKRDAETVVEIEFAVLADMTKSAGSRFGSVTDTAI